MTYGRAAIPALAGALLLTALLWWAGASVNALHLQGTAEALGGKTVADLEYWLNPWSYDPPESVRLGTLAQGGTGSDYAALYGTANQIRFAAVFAFFVPGALLLVRRLPPVDRRLPATLLTVWAWGLVAGTLAVTVSAPWVIASQGRGSYRFLPQLAGMMTAGRQILVPLALVAALVTVLIARITAKGAGDLPRAAVPARAARTAATVGTLVVAVSLVVLSYQPVAGRIQSVSLYGRLLSEPGDFLRQWLLLGGWDGPAGTSISTWLLYRTADGLLLAVVWCALRWVPGLLTRATVPATAAVTVCATVIGLLAGQLLRIAVDSTGLAMLYGPVHLMSALGTGVPAALFVGSVAGVLAAPPLRRAGTRAEAGPPAPLPDHAAV
ncbi:MULTISPECIES: hypothetical protein [unclassified Streptomyces]|uniref:hypothetical protein n=1 Tax=unclassified Streptomyces TaxID=2593676 RepID=UPI00093C3722|nr:hypothetical protein [Streptomyces sp. CB02058]OKI87454.1 hypothetical protein AMK10_34195 [Streptomyces sp. CB02058]